VDISRQYSKGLSALLFKEYGVLVILGQWKDPSRLPPARRVVREIIPDPAGQNGTEEEVLNGFRHIRDFLWERITSWERDGVFLPEPGENGKQPIGNVHQVEELNGVPGE